MNWLDDGKATILCELSWPVVNGLDEVVNITNHCPSIGPSTKDDGWLVDDSSYGVLI